MATTRPRQLIGRALENSLEHIIETLVMLSFAQVAAEGQILKCPPNPLLSIELEIVVFNWYVLYDLDQVIGGDFVGFANVDERKRASGAGRIPVFFHLKVEVVESTLDVKIVLASVFTRNKPKANSASVGRVIDASAMYHDVRIE